MATTEDRQKIFVDTNVLLRAHVSSAPLHNICYQALEKISEENTELWISRQIIREYMVHVTRPQKFAQPLDAKLAIDQIRRFDDTFRIADETVIVTEKLFELVETIPIGGKQVHDANIVATMLTYNVTHLLTLNTIDFERFSSLISLVNPLPNA
jgi:predicted nucleic acid-binding protein